MEISTPIFKINPEVEDTFEGFGISKQRAEEMHAEIFSVLGRLKNKIEAPGEEDETVNLMGEILIPFMEIAKTQQEGFYLMFQAGRKIEELEKAFDMFS